MKLEKILFISSIIGILILIILSQTTNPIYAGEVKSIQFYNNKIIIQIKNSSTKLILFKTNYINLTKNNIIEFQGKQDTYKNNPEIIINKIIKIK